MIWSPGQEEIVAMDGKALRRALRRREGPPVMISAWARENGLVLRQLQVRDRSNEVTAVPGLLQALAGCIVTLDAQGCQRNIAQEIKAAGAEYGLALKGNQTKAHEAIQNYLEDAIGRGAKELVRHQTAEKDHGRIERRTYWQSGRLDWFADRRKWEGLQSVGVVESRRQVGDHPPPSNGAIICRAWWGMSNDWPGSFAGTGAWRNSVIGHWT